MQNHKNVSNSFFIEKTKYFFTGRFVERMERTVIYTIYIYRDNHYL